MTRLPPDWARTVLSQLIGAEGVFSDGDWIETKDQDPAGDVRLVQLADVGKGEYRNRSSRFLTLAKARELGCTFLEPGDILVARLPDPLGRACIFPGDPRRSVTAVDVCIIRPGPTGVNPRWLMWMLNAPQTRAVIAGLAKGTTRLRISRRNLGQIPIAVPPVPEQERIVAAIEEEFSRLEVGVRAFERVRTQLVSLMKAVLLTAIPAVPPPDWRLTTVGEAGEVGLGRQRSPKVHNGPNMRPYLRVANVFEDRIDTSDVMSMHFSDEEFARFRLEPGDVLLNEGQSPHLLGRPAIYRGDPPDVAFTNSLLRFRAGPGVLPEWALLVFRRHLHAKRFMRESQITTNIAHISAGRFKTVEFPIPSVTDQLRVLAEVETKLSLIRRTEDALHTQLARANALRSAILSAAFSGRLVRQDPLEEPASVLLKQIAASRSQSNGDGLTSFRQRTTVTA